MNDIVHIVRATKDGIESIIGVFAFDGDAAAHKALFDPEYDRIEIDAWIVQSDAIFETYLVTKADLYAVGSTVLYDDEGTRRIGEVIYSDEDQRKGFPNVMYRIEREQHGVLSNDYFLGSNIIGNITKKACQSGNLV